MHTRYQPVLTGQFPCLIKYSTRSPPETHQHLTAYVFPSTFDSGGVSWALFQHWAPLVKRYSFACTSSPLLLLSEHQLKLNLKTWIFFKHLINSIKCKESGFHVREKKTFALSCTYNKWLHAIETFLCQLESYLIFIFRFGIRTTNQISCTKYNIKSDTAQLPEYTLCTEAKVPSLVNPCTFNSPKLSGLQSAMHEPLLFSE